MAARRAPRSRSVLDREPAEGVRLLALELLADAQAAAGRLTDGADGEALHDFRVAVRRLRSWLRSFAPLVKDTLRKKRLRALRDVAGATGAARDAEVMRAALLAERQALAPRHRRAADRLLARLAPAGGTGADSRAEAARAFAALAPHLEAALSRYTREVDAAAPNPSFGAAAAEALRGQLRALADALAQVGGPDDVKRAHRARIEGKRLRYLLEPLCAAAPPARAAVATMKGLQDLLGELHDVHVLAAQVDAAEAAVAGERADAGLEALVRRIRARRDGLHAQLARDWLGAASREGAGTSRGKHVEGTRAQALRGQVARTMRALNGRS